MEIRKDEVVLPGIGVVPRLTEREAMKGQPAEAAHVVEFVGSAVGLPQVDKALAPLCARRGDAWSRKCDGPRLDALNQALEELKPAVQKAQAILADNDLKDGVAQARASGIMQKALEETAPKVRKVLESAAQYATWTRACVQACFALGTDAASREDAREVRDRLYVVAPEDRTNALLALAGRGLPEVLGAAFADPLGGLCPDEGFNQRLREVCLRAADLDWLQAQATDACEGARHLALLSEITCASICRSLDLAGVDRNGFMFTRTMKTMLAGEAQD